MGCCGQSGQRVNPAKPIFLLPGAAFHSHPVALAMRRLFAPVKQECPVCSVLVGRQLSHQSMCMLLGCLLEAAYAVHWTLPHLPLHSHKA